MKSNLTTLSLVIILISQKRVIRLPALTGNENITSEGELENEAYHIIKESLWRPIEISIFEPMVLSINLYLSLNYSIAY